MTVVQPMSSLQGRSPWEVVQEEFACTHERTKKVRRVYANGVETVWSQCQNCGGALRALPKKDVLNIYVLPLFDEGLQKAWGDRQNARKAELEQVRRGEWFESYNRYLESSEWRKLRQLVFDRAQGICEGCGANSVAEVHHLTYERVGHEMLFDLAAVCRPCHRKITRWARERK